MNSEEKEDLNSKIVDFSSKYISNDELKVILEPFVINSILSILVNSNSEELLKTLRIVVNQLTEIIEILENQILIKKKKLKKSNNICSNWKIEKKLTKELIEISENIIFENEQKLLAIETNRFSVLSKNPNIIKKLNKIFIQIPREILLNSKIKWTRKKRLKQINHLMKIDNELSKTFLIVYDQQNLLKNLESLKLDFRRIRIKIGTNYSKIIKIIKKKKTLTLKDEIIQTFGKNLRQINNFSLKFKNNVVKK